MNRPVVRLALGFGLLSAGATFLVGAAMYRNALVQRAISAIDFTDRACRGAAVANGSACPTGCAVRPPRQPSDRYAPPECRSVIWVATCGKACAPAPGFVRLSDGALASAGALEVELRTNADAEAFARRLGALGARADAGVSGLDRYRVTFENPKNDRRLLEKFQRVLSSMEDVGRVVYETR